MQFAVTGFMTGAVLLIGGRADAASTVIPCNHCGLPRISSARAATSKAIAHGRLAASDHIARSYDQLFGPGQAAALGLTDRRAFHRLEAGETGFSIETVRRVAIRPGAADTGMRRDKLSAGSMTLRYATSVGDDDSVALGFDAGIEKRRFAFDLAQGRHARSQSLGLVAGWSHGANWRLETGFRADFGSRQSPPLERGIELAEGAQRSERGVWTALTYSIGKPSEPGLSLGVRAQAFRLVDADRLALGASSRSDNRVALTASIRFR